MPAFISLILKVVILSTKHKFNFNFLSILLCISVPNFCALLQIAQCYIITLEISTAKHPVFALCLVSKFNAESPLIKLI